jgi:hypothetical protein
MNTMTEYLSADGYPVEVGKKFWDNDLRVVQILQVAYIPARPYSDTGETSTWHKHTGGSSDTLTGYMRQYGRLARYFEGKDAEKFDNGTQYADTK